MEEIAGFYKKPPESVAHQAVFLASSKLANWSGIGRYTIKLAIK